MGSSINRRPRRSGKVSESPNRNLYSRAHDLVGERNPREHKFAVQAQKLHAGADQTPLKPPNI